jgi:predicted Zn-dependent protease
MDYHPLSATDRLEEGLEDSEYNYHFLVFDSEMINAFTVPGGNRAAYFHQF